MKFIIDLIKAYLVKEPTRVVAYAVAIATAGALKLAEILGVTLTSEFLVGLAAVVTFVATEVIRKLVYAPDTVQAIAERAADTGNTDIGDPPEGPTDDEMGDAEG